MELQSLTVRPYIYNRCEEFTMELCQKQGWFEGKKLSEISNDDKKHPCWINNWNIAIASYLFWREDF